MPRISHKTLVIAIQSVASELRTLREALAEGGGKPEECQFFEDVEQAAEDLKSAYDEAAKTVTNLPSYNKLVGGWQTQKRGSEKGGGGN